MSDEARALEYLNGLRQQGWSCPKADHWVRFHELLSENSSDDLDQPPRPFILAALVESAGSKHCCLSEQLYWAIGHGCFEKALEFLEHLEARHWEKCSPEQWDTVFD